MEIPHKNDTIIATLANLSMPLDNAIILPEKITPIVAKNIEMRL